ncbi:MAG TPA: hypothetical protein VGD65_09210 [Chryseosolibacter sp.]
MKNILHTVSSVCLVIWLIGFVGYEVVPQFHLLLLAGVIAAIISVRMPKKPLKLKAKKLSQTVNP